MYKVMVRVTEKGLLLLVILAALFDEFLESIP